MYTCQLFSYVPATNKWNVKLKSIPFTLALPKTTNLGINLTKYVQDLCEENYKTLISKIKE